MRQIYDVFNLALCGRLGSLFQSVSVLNLKAPPQAFNCTLVAPSTHEVDNTICSPSPHRTNHNFKKRKIYLSVPWQRFHSATGSLLGECETHVELLFFLFKRYWRYLHQHHLQRVSLSVRIHIDDYIHVDHGALRAWYRIRQMSLSGFQRCQRQMLPSHFKGDILLAFCLDHFQDIIRFQHMSTCR